MMPGAPSPTAWLQAASAAPGSELDGNVTPMTSSVTDGELAAVQDEPPLAVYTIVPPTPTAIAWFGSPSALATPLSWLEVPDVWPAHAAPPSVVCRMMPEPPTAQPLELSANPTPYRFAPA